MTKHKRSSVRLKSHIPPRAVLAATLCASFSLASANASDVGVVVDYSPAGATLYLSRAGVQSPVAIEIATVVQAGDEIRLLANSTVTIELADDRRITSSGPGTWAVPSAPALGPIAEFFHRIEFIVDPNYSRTATAITRGSGRCASGDAPPIAAPILPARAQIKAGVRGVSIAWTGGCAPYHLALNSKQSALQKKGGLNESQFRFEHLSLTPGSYSITITDVTGKSATFPFVARSEGPAPPSTLSADSSYLGDIARALWLSEADEGTWRIDSVEVLLPRSRGHDPLAAAIVQMLLRQTAVQPKL